MEKSYKVLDSIEIQKSSRELKYTDIKIDFKGGTIEDLPFYMQEMQIYDINNKLLFTGYLESYKMPELTMLNSIENELTLTLMTPRTMATKKRL